jgi:hypothetical protein
MSDYGFNRLVLLNSAGYARAELPLDDTVSLLAENNTGKTSLINALQFLLIINRKSMNFGAHDLDKSRKFYFPDNSSYIMLEALLPTGMVVMGCVGKGIGHDYEYFAYKGSLNIDEFCLPNGSIVPQPRFHQHLASFDKIVRTHDSQAFRQIIYGSGKGRDSTNAEFTVFRLEHSGYAEVFQKVLRNTLRLDKLTSEMVKAHLLEIFRRDIPSASVNFKDEWEHVFAEVIAERAQYNAAFLYQKKIEQMADWQQKRRQLRGKIIYYRPLLDEQLGKWHSHFQQEQQRIKDLQDQVTLKQNGLLKRNQELTTNKVKNQTTIVQLRNDNQRFATLNIEFALVNREQLDDEAKRIKQELDEKIRLIGNVSSRSQDAIRRELGNVQNNIKKTERTLETLADNLYLRLRELLSDDELNALNHLLNTELLTLSPEKIHFNADQAKTIGVYLRQHLQEGIFYFPGMQIPLDLLKAQHTQQTPEALQDELKDLYRQADELQTQWQVAQDFEREQREKVRLEKEDGAHKEKLNRFNEKESLLQNEPKRTENLLMLEGVLSEIQGELDGMEQKGRDLQDEFREYDQSLQTLRRQNTDIDRLRNQRIDRGVLFEHLSGKPHDVWAFPTPLGITELASFLQAYHHDCQTLNKLENDLENELRAIQQAGLTKYQTAESAEQEIEKIIEFAQHLPQENVALENKARTAVVALAVSLRQLRSGLDSLTHRMRQFNALFENLHLSDLKLFKVKATHETLLVEAIDLLIRTSGHIEAGESFDLFNQQSVLDDPKLNQAKALLIEQGQARNGLQIKDLFRLEFVLAKLDQTEETFEEIDSAASNGTVLMAKLLTGLALLNLMLDKRKGQEVRGVCFLDEATSLDQRNQQSLIQTAGRFGFSIIFAAPTPLVTARYCVPIMQQKNGKNIITHRSWQLLESIGD